VKKTGGPWFLGGIQGPPRSNPESAPSGVKSGSRFMSSTSSPSSYKKNSTGEQSGDKPKVRLASYPWYFEDWLFSETRASFTLAERGLYRDLLDYCWYYGSLPADVEILGKLCGEDWSPRQLRSKKRTTLIQNVTKKFHILADGRYHHPKVDEKRKLLVGFNLQRQRAGKKSAQVRKKTSTSVQRALQPSPSPSLVKVEEKAAAISTRPLRGKNFAAAKKTQDPTDERKPAGRVIDFWPYSPENVGAVRDSLCKLAREIRLPDPDDGLVRQVLDAGRGASGSAIHETLVGLFRRGKFRNIQSWGLVPVVLEPWFARRTG